jgi:hypothetical protein
MCQIRPYTQITHNVRTKEEKKKEEERIVKIIRKEEEHKERTLYIQRTYTYPYQG